MIREKRKVVKKVLQRHRICQLDRELKETAWMMGGGGGWRTKASIGARAKEEETRRFNVGEGGRRRNRGGGRVGRCLGVS
jgi:hypothetical protein